MMRAASCLLQSEPSRSIFGRGALATGGRALASIPVDRSSPIAWQPSSVKRRTSRPGPQPRSKTRPWPITPRTKDCRGRICACPCCVFRDWSAGSKGHSATRVGQGTCRICAKQNEQVLMEQSTCTIWCVQVTMIHGTTCKTQNAQVSTGQ